MLRWLILLVCLSLLMPAHACMWDSDTLATEAKGLPDVVQVITGRFPRNPPLFYEMRLARVSKQIAAQPANLGLYDDAAVACDRLHRDKEAIAWMAKKRAQLKPFPLDKEHWYRYHANLGTFQAHDWLRSGANRKNLAEMKSARDHIAQAIKINPNAHFGREKYQLMAMEWIIKPPPISKSFGKIDGLPSFIDVDEETEGARVTQTAKGLAGLIVLGDAWESFDIFVALRNAMATRSAPTAYLASLRCEELVGIGRTSLCPGAPTGEALLQLIHLEGKAPPVMLAEERRPGIQKQYTKLRSEADEYQQRRTVYMLERLKAGRHPDTDANFWKDWHDAGPPVIDDAPPLTPTQIMQRILIVFFGLISALIMATVYCWRIWRKRRRVAA